MPKPLQPASTIISKFDGVRSLARLLEVAPSTVSRWAKPREAGGTGGAIPTRQQAEILKLSIRMRKGLKAGDLVQS